jgi:hypothetical protein
VQTQEVTQSKSEPKPKPKPKKVKKKKKRTAMVLCRDDKSFWTTQKQFWQWVREGKLVRTGYQPLRGSLVHEHEEMMVVLSNTVLNLAHPIHLREALNSRRIGFAKRRSSMSRDKTIRVRSPF